MTDKDEVTTYPCCGYKLGDDNEVVSKVFDIPEGEKLPDGWHDTPAKVKPRGRPKAS